MFVSRDVIEEVFKDKVDDLLNRDRNWKDSEDGEKGRSWLVSRAGDCFTQRARITTEASVLRDLAKRLNEASDGQLAIVVPLTSLETEWEQSLEKQRAGQKAEPKQKLCSERRSWFNIFHS